MNFAEMNIKSWGRAHAANASINVLGKTEDEGVQLTSDGKL